ncbi:hypothetical protein Pmani_024181 [Petrolisthes manimaculis]|uniref:Uncharacterized protein n=1 Tax=Petrolisthes manimaculis TaxID=1843537 RepID=A0AAE1PAQ4_9EUCA|nr:hypothetical protein Pmani_024181 [Petrolisthes manimaculis]
MLCWGIYYIVNIRLQQVPVPAVCIRSCLINVSNNTCNVKEFECGIKMCCVVASWWPSVPSWRGGVQSSYLGHQEN